jgi:hypothetical protein
MSGRSWSLGGAGSVRSSGGALPVPECRQRVYRRRAHRGAACLPPNSMPQERSRTTGMRVY